jgi:hypothetical protein
MKLDITVVAVSYRCFQLNVSLAAMMLFMIGIENRKGWSKLESSGSSVYSTGI